jgi:hypothetical protein
MNLKEDIISVVVFEMYIRGNVCENSFQFLSVSG